MTTLNDANVLYQLSYRGLGGLATDGAPDRTRTCDNVLGMELRVSVCLDGRTSPMVGVPGFEPGTSCSRSRRATRLRYTPMVLVWISLLGR